MRYRFVCVLIVLAVMATMAAGLAQARTSPDSASIPAATPLESLLGGQNASVRAAGQERPELQKPIVGVARGGYPYPDPSPTDPYPINLVSYMPVVAREGDVVPEPTGDETPTPTLTPTPTATPTPTPTDTPTPTPTYTPTPESYPYPRP